MIKKLYSSLVLLLFCSGLSFGQGFTDVAESNELDFSYSTEEYGGGVSFADFNQDGLDDLTFATEAGQPVRFFLNNGNGFEAVTDLVSDSSGVKQVLWLDYNNDQLLDLYLTSEGKNKLYRNNGNLQLEDVTLAAGFNFPLLTSYCSTWFDYDKDGKLDLLVAHRTIEKEGWIDLYKNIDLQSFEKTTIQAGLKSKGESVLAMTTLDYNNDGWTDIFLGQDWEKGNKLFKNNGNSTFKDVSRISGIDFKMNSMTATVMDINEDGWQDLYVSNTTMGNVLLVNKGDGSFEEKAAYYNLDLTNVTFGTVFFDADNDGDNDVHVGGLQVNHTFEDVNEEEEFKKRNNDWGFSSDRKFNNGVATGDFNNDGFIDIVKNSVTRGDFFVSKNSLWQNNFNQNNFIKIKLAGTVSNHFGIGAKVNVHTNEKIQHKRIACGESFSSQHSLIQHFGIEQTEVIDSVVVVWPSNNISVLKNIPANQTLLVSEPPYGCTDIQACNYNPTAETDNGSCRFTQEFYDCNGCIDDIDQDGICDQLEINGCDEYNACNFSEEATENDGSCYYLPIFEISGPSLQEALTEIKYSYPSQTRSLYNWSIQQGSIVAGNQSNEVTVIWYEKDQGTLSVQEIDEFNCNGNIVFKEIEITPSTHSPALDLWVSPNPAQNFLTVHNLKIVDHPFVIYNSIGKLVMRGNLDESQNQISISNLSSGLYFLEISGTEMPFTNSFFKK